MEAGRTYLRGHLRCCPPVRVRSHARLLGYARDGVAVVLERPRCAVQGHLGRKLGARLAQRILGAVTGERVWQGLARGVETGGGGIWCGGEWGRGQWRFSRTRAGADAGADAAAQGEAEAERLGLWPPDSLPDRPCDTSGLVDHLNQRGRYGTILEDRVVAHLRACDGRVRAHMQWQSQCICGAGGARDRMRANQQW